MDTNSPPTPSEQRRLRNRPDSRVVPAFEETQVPVRPPVGPAALQNMQSRLPHRRKRTSGMLISFIIFVGVPVAVAIAYFGFFGSNQYVSEFRFSVEDTSQSMQASAAASNVVSSVLGSSSSPSTPQNYLVIDYLTSRQVVDELETRIHLKELYTRPDIDWWARFNPSRPKEAFVLYWQRMIDAKYDLTTGIATVEVRAFTPQDAKKIADVLVTLAEELINRIAMRTQFDAVRFADAEVRRAEDRLKVIRAKLTEYRNKEGVIDPNASIVASNSGLSQSLRQNLAYLETTLASLMKQNIGPNAPAVQSLTSQIKATKEQIRIVDTQVANNKSGTALSVVVAEYEQLDLERQFAQNMVTSTMQALDQARALAAAQHLYITPYVRPGLPDSSIYPRRVRSILLTALFSFIIWTILLLVGRSVGEHYAGPH